MLATLLALGACGDRSDPVLHLETNGSLRIQPSTVTVADGQAIEVSATLRDGSGRRMERLPDGAVLRWSSFGGTVVRVEGDGLTARISGLQPGRSTIQAAMGTLVATADVRVDAVPARIESRGPAVVLGLSGEVAPHPARVQVLDRHGSPVADVPVTFAVVSGGGSVTTPRTRSDAFGVAETPWVLGTAPGLQTVEARVEEVASTQLFSYVNGDLASVTLSAVSAGGSAGVVGQALPEVLEIRARDDRGRPVLGVGVEWTASAGTLLPTAPTTDVEGKARAQWILGPNPGIQTASARLLLPDGSGDPASGSPGNVAVTFEARAEPAPPSLVSALPERLVLGLGDAARIGLAVFDALGNTLPGPYAATWTVEDAGIASVGAHPSGDAILSGLRAGSTRAIVTVGALADTVEIQVRSGTGSGGGGPAVPVALDVTPDTLTLQVGRSGGLAATARDASGQLLPTADAEWRSEDPEIATVDAFGRVAAVAEGEARITVTLGSLTAWSVVQVTAAPPPPSSGGTPERVVDLRVTSATSSSLDLAFTAGDDGLGGPAYHEIRYSPSPMGLGWGQATLVSGGACAAPLRPTVAGQQIRCTVAGLAAGRSYDFQLVTWRWTASEAVFSPLSNLATGSTLAGGDEPGSQVDRVIVSPGTAVVAPDATLQLSAVALDAAGREVPGLTTSWGSTNPAVATVDGTGRVTGVAPGAVSIRASMGGRTGTASVSVSSGSSGGVASVTVSPTATTLAPGGSTTLSAVARDGSGTILSGVSFSWSSSNPGVATVDGSGRVSAVQTGSTTVTASAQGISGSAQITVSAPPPPPPPPPSGVWAEQTWNFPDRAAMFADPNLDPKRYGPENGEARPIVLAQPGPWGGSRAVEIHFNAAPLETQPQVGVEWYLPPGAREMWVETWIRFAPEWNVGPPSQIGHVDHKTMFFFESGFAQRWELKFGPNFEDCVAAAGPHYVVGFFPPVVGLFDYDKYVAAAANRCKASQAVWDDRWHQIRVHLKMGAGDGNMEAWLDGQKYIDMGGAVDTQSGSRTFHSISFGANRNSGPQVPMSFFFGPARVFLSNPGW